MSDHDACKLHTSVVKIHLVHNCELLLQPLTYSLLQLLLGQRLYWKGN